MIRTCFLICLLGFVVSWLQAEPVNAQALDTTPSHVRSHWSLDTSAFVADGSQNVRLLGHIGGTVNTVFVQGSKAYVGQGRSLTILAVEQPTPLRPLGKTPALFDNVLDVVVQNNIAYLAVGNAGLEIFDLSNPAQPLRLGFYDTPGKAEGVAVQGNYAYIADGAAGLQIINLATVSAPNLVGTYNTSGTAYDVTVAGNNAFVADWERGLRIINVANPAAPSEIGFYNPTPGQAYSVQVVGNYAYMVEGDFLRAVDITNLAAPHEVGRYDPLSGWAVDVVVSGSYAYVADYDQGLRIVDIADPTNLREVGAYGTPTGAEGVYVADNYAYLTGSLDGMMMINVTDPVSPTETASYDTPIQVYDVEITEQAAYLAAGDKLRVMDLTNPITPRVLGFYDTPGWAQTVDVYNNHAYVNEYDNGLQVFDLTNPVTPTWKSKFPNFGNSQKIYFSGNYAYVADEGAGLHILDITNSSALAEVGSFLTTGDVFDVDILGSNAYLADGHEGLRIVNIDNPNAPKQVGVWDTPEFAYSVYVEGNYAYVADGVGGLQVINISTPATPTKVASLVTPGSALDIYVTGNYAYIADGDSLRIVNVTNPANPIEVGFFAAPQVGRVKVVNGIIYLTGDKDGLYLLRYPACYRLTLKYTGLGGIPNANPTNSTGCGASEYVPGTQVTLSANAAPGWQVASWLGADRENSTSKNNSVAMLAVDHEVTVNYAPICYGLTLTHTGNGSNPVPTPANSIGCSAGQFVAGEVINLTAGAGPGATVGSWSGTSNNSSSANANTLVMPATNHSSGVNYVLACYQLTLTHSGSGSDPVATPGQSIGCPAGRYHANASIAISGATPAQGWQIGSWSGTATNASTANSNTVTMPLNDHTVTINYSETPTSGPGDSYETDGACTRSRVIASDGSEEQIHTFHAVADADWVRFTAVSGQRYRIEVQVPVTSTADVNLEVYAQCETPSFDGWNGSFSPGARLDITAPASGPIYVRLANQDANLAGEKVQYSVVVRPLDGDAGQRALILVAGRLKGTDSLQKNIHNVTNAVYKLFQANGYTDANILYLATDDRLPGYDAAVSKESLRSAIVTWAKDKVGSDGVLNLYLMDHGSPDSFYLDELSNQRLTPDDLNSWLNELENAAPNVKINVFIEACQSGSFITKPGSISKAGRVVITSSNDENDAKASKDGAYFSDHLLTWLRQGYNLAAAFSEASNVARTIFSLQRALLDADGNGIPNEFSDSNSAAKRSFAYAGSLGDEWAPHIFAVASVNPARDQKARLRVDVRDDQRVRQVWAVVYEPGYMPPPAGQILQPEVLPTFLFIQVDNDNHWEAEITGLSKPGVYRLIIHADDEQGLVARPVSFEVTLTSTGQNEFIYLPIINNKK